MLSNLDISVRSNVKAQLDQWAANSNVAHLNNAYTNLHIVLDVVRGWPSSKEQNLRAAAATLRESVKSSHTHLQSLQQAVEETKTILENERDSIHQQLDQREDVSIGRFQELEQSLIQAAQRQDQIEARLDSIVATHQDTFTKAGAGRLAEHQQALKDRRAEFAESLDRAVQESQETLESQQASGENVLARLGELEDQAKKVVEAVALAGTSTDYGKYAKEQKETADQLRRGAIALFVVAAIITGVWVIWIGAEEIELGAILLRLGPSLSFLCHNRMTPPPEGRGQS
jgi:DNA anti-recombination protein RmuC